MKRGLFILLGVGFVGLMQLQVRAEHLASAERAPASTHTPEKHPYTSRIQEVTAPVSKSEVERMLKLWDDVLVSLGFQNENGEKKEYFPYHYANEPLDRHHGL